MALSGITARRRTLTDVKQLSTRSHRGPVKNSACFVQCTCTRPRALVYSSSVIITLTAKDVSTYIVIYECREEGAAP